MVENSDELRRAGNDWRRVLRLLAAMGVLVFAAVLGLGWWLGYFDTAPEQATLQGAVDALSEDPAAAAVATESIETPESEVPDGQAASEVSGTWTVASGNDATFVGYRINEVLTTIGDFEVVGRTSEVEGTVEIDGTEIVAGDFSVNMAALTTDNDRRDAAMREQALETDQFPTATFVLTEPIELDSLPTEAVSVAVEAAGELTVHGVTQGVVIPLEAQRLGSVIVVVGQLDMALADFGIDPPQAPIVASVEDRAILEMSLVLTRSE